MNLRKERLSENIPYDVESALSLIISFDAELKIEWENHIKKEYESQQENVEKLYYLDIRIISEFVIEKFQNQQTENFTYLFNNIENILRNCNQETKSLITLGLFEGMQNICAEEHINYHYGFNKWLQNVSSEQWRAVIDFWEGIEWKKYKNK